ncbi:MAG: hypothetical protein ACFFAV_17615 [Candidatus Hermodarchaeota archaeon]
MFKIKSDSWQSKIIILAVFIIVIILTAEVDWAAENSGVGLMTRLFWLISLLILGLVLPIGFMYLAGNKEIERGESDKKGLIIAIVLFLIANGIPIIFYVVLRTPPGPLLYLQLSLFGLIPAFFLQPKRKQYRILILVILFAVIIIPIGILVNFAIDDLWAGALDNTMYYLSFWGLLMTFFYLILAIGWKLGGGSKRQSWNIFLAGTLLQFSTLEDFFYFLLNGQSLPGLWPWMNNFVINLEVLFGHIPTDLDLLVFCLITSAIAILILFDIHGIIWTKIKEKK